jgi:hypothetical protein
MTQFKFRIFIRIIIRIIIGCWLYSQENPSRGGGEQVGCAGGWGKPVNEARNVL